KYLAWKSQARAGFEADKWRLMLQDRQSGKTRDLTEKFDRSVGSFAWHPIPYQGAYGIVFTSENRGNSLLYALPSDNSLQDLTTHSRHADDVVFAPNTQLYFTNMSINSSSEIWHFDMAPAEGLAMVAIIPPAAVTHMNDAVLSQIDMQPLESFTFKG